ncbi:MAG: alkaline phosphatase D family protein [Brachymonas sp.]|nr:alkaline phosphatase D family protein [Brachymonas sp.]
MASGDPLADRVILWTHAQIPNSDKDVELAWEVANDPGFSRVVKTGTVKATAATGFTAKADATGLVAGNTYYFRFRSGAALSSVGCTRTLPAPGASEVALAVFSCSNYPAGFFSAYAEAAKTNAQFAVHLGDYIYEYAADGYASADAAALGRVSAPTHECLTLDDYRQRYAQYRSDPDSKVLHAAMPLIAVWDDHEIANDAWLGGAENHTEGAEGSFVARRAAAVQAWAEWMPVRLPDAANPLKIYRSFDFGGLLALHMLDTRIIGRDKQISFNELMNPATAQQATATLASTTRSILGQEQLQWLQGQLAASNATWQVLGQQVLMGRMEFPVSVLMALNPSDTSPAAQAAGQKAISDYLTAKAVAAQNPAALTQAQQDLLDTTKNPKLGYNLDAWDGYPVEREIVLASAAQLRKKLVVLSGDTHNAWAAKLTLRNGVQVGQEFAATSVSAPGFEEYLTSIPPGQLAAIFKGVVDDLQYCETARRGFLLMQFSATKAEGTYYLLDTVKSKTYSVDSQNRHVYGA